MGPRFLFAVLGLVLGTVLGAWQPRGELLGLREENLRLQREARSCRRGAASAGIAQLLGGRRADASATARGERPEPTPAAPPPGEAAPPPGDDGTPAPAPARSTVTPIAPDVRTPEAMREALDARAAQARAALLEQAEPSDEELAAIDAAVETMNARLKTQVDAFAAAIEAGQEPDRRELMEFAAEALDAVIEADDAFVASLPEEVRQDVDAEVLDPFSYIDGSTLEALARLEGLGE